MKKDIYGNLEIHLKLILLKWKVLKWHWITLQPQTLARILLTAHVRIRGSTKELTLHIQHTQKWLQETKVYTSLCPKALTRQLKSMTLPLLKQKRRKRALCHCHASTLNKRIGSGQQCWLWVQAARMQIPVSLYGSDIRQNTSPSLNCIF